MARREGRSVFSDFSVIQLGYALRVPEAIRPFLALLQTQLYMTGGTEDDAFTTTIAFFAS